MYQVNDLIIYGNEGICKIVDIKIPDILDIDTKKLYYELKPVYGNEIIYTPVDTKIYIRPIISSEEAQNLLKTIPLVSLDIFEENQFETLEDHYKSIFHSHDCAKLIQMIKTLYVEKNIAVKSNKKFGHLQENYLNKAENLLFGELSVSLDMPKENIKDIVMDGI